MLETVKKIKEIMENIDYMYYGLRCDDKLYSVGDICEKSYEWYQDDPEDESYEYDQYLGIWKGDQLEGTCGIKLRKDNIGLMLDRMNMYCYAKHLYLIGADWVYGGNDQYEGIFEDAEVLAILR